jgi:hypothetical protein
MGNTESVPAAPAATPPPAAPPAPIQRQEVRIDPVVTAADVIAQNRRLAVDKALTWGKNVVGQTEAKRAIEASFFPASAFSDLL